jgi:hypothetical protein
MTTPIRVISYTGIESVVSPVSVCVCTCGSSRVPPLSHVWFVQSATTLPSPLLSQDFHEHGQLELQLEAATGVPESSMFALAQAGSRWVPLAELRPPSSTSPPPHLCANHVVVVVVVFDASIPSRPQDPVPALQPEQLTLPPQPAAPSSPLLLPRTLSPDAQSLLLRIEAARAESAHLQAVAEALAEGADERAVSLRIAVGQLERQGVAVGAAASFTAEGPSAEVAAQSARRMALVGRADKCGRVVAGALSLLEGLRAVPLHPGHAAALATPATAAPSSSSSSLYDAVPVAALREWIVRAEDAAILAASACSSSSTALASAAGAGAQVGKVAAEFAATTASPPSPAAPPFTSQPPALLLDAGEQGAKEQGAAARQVRAQAAVVRDAYATAVAACTSGGPPSAPPAADESGPLRAVAAGVAAAAAGLLASKTIVAGMRSRDGVLRGLQTDMRFALQAAAGRVRDAVAALASARSGAAGARVAVDALHAAVVEEEDMAAELYHLRVLPGAYDALCAETARRRAFPRAYEEAAAAALAHLDRMRGKEAEARAVFAERHAPHLPAGLLAGMEEGPVRVRLAVWGGGAGEDDDGMRPGWAGAGTLPPVDEGGREGDVLLPRGSAADASPSAAGVGVGAAATFAAPLLTPRPASAPPPPPPPPPSPSSAVGPSSPTLAALALENAALRAELTSLLAVAKVPRLVAARYVAIGSALRAGLRPGGGPPPHAARHPSAHTDEATTSVLLNLCRSISAAETAGIHLANLVEGEEDEEERGQAIRPSSSSPPPPPPPPSTGRYGQVRASDVTRRISAPEPAVRPAPSTDDVGAAVAAFVAGIGPAEPLTAHLATSVGRLLHRITALQTGLRASLDDVAALVRYINTSAVCVRGPFLVGSNVLFFPSAASYAAFHDDGVEGAGGGAEATRPRPVPTFVHPASLPAFRAAWGGRPPDFILGTVTEIEVRTSSRDSPPSPFSLIATAGGGGTGGVGGLRPRSAFAAPPAAAAPSVSGNPFGLPLGTLFAVARVSPLGGRTGPAGGASSSSSVLLPTMPGEVVSAAAAADTARNRFVERLVAQYLEVRRARKRCGAGGGGGAG